MARKKKFKLISLRKKRRWRPRKKSNFWKLFFVLFILCGVIPAVFAFMWFRKNILEKLPPVSKIEKVVFSQTTTITDRNGIVLYKVFDQNRKYVSLNKISKNMQNAIVATEDKTFWTNPWIDITWIIRAGIHDIVFWQKQGGSTLTQQLIKNLLLTNKKTITRKLKEIVLSLQLSKYLEQKIKKQYPNLSTKEIKQKMKEKILEMYLNYIFFWNNSYWVEAASETYFHKPASQLTVLESAVLASIPKSPVKYDPLRNRANNLGELIVTDLSWNKVSLNSPVWKQAISTYISYLKDQAFALMKSESDIVKALSPDNLTYQKYKIQYIPGRKDFILARMYLDWYIDKGQLIQAIKEWFTEKIYPPKLTIKDPWFVFYVLNILNKKYWEDVVAKAWWTIKTSLDRNIEKLAEQSVKDYAWYLTKKWANNTALLYVDTKNWDILAYVWSKNYYDKSIDWQVDIIQSKRQCGSVMKPLIYANAFIKNKWFTPETPVYDVKFDIAEKWHTFNNFDWKFLGLLPIKKALPYSRNIPAAKMYYLWWWEYPVKEFLHKLWLKTISNKIYYGYPLAIWAAEVRMIDVAQAYSYLSNINWAVKINPILEIRWPDGSLIYKKQPEKLPMIIPPWVVSMLWYILSNPANRPPTWNYIMQIPGLTLATKSGTTDVIDKKNGKKYPRDGWFISYSPSKVFVVWAGNTKWQHMHIDAYGGWTAGKVWRDFVLKLKKAGYIKNENMKLKWTTTIYVDSLNGKLATNKTPIQVSKKTIARIDWIPPKDDGKTVQMIEIDKLCTWLVSKFTPPEDKIYAYLVHPHSLNPADPKWEQPVQEWWKKTGVKKYKKIFNAPVLLKKPTSTCKIRQIVAEKGSLKFDIVWPKNNQKLAYVFDVWLKILNAPFEIKKIDVFVDWRHIATYNYSLPVFTVVIPYSIKKWFHKLTIKLTDKEGLTYSKSININLVSIDNDKPFLDKIEKKNWKYLYIFKDNTSKVVWWYLICSDKKTKFTGSFAMSNSDNCWYDIVDYYWNENINSK